MSTLVASNALVLRSAQLLFSALQFGCSLRLFRDAVTITPSTPFAAFAEANFAGYSSINLNGQFLTPKAQVVGEVLIDLPVFQFMPFANDPQLIYGAYVTNGGNWYWAGLFPMPLPVVNATPIAVHFGLQNWSLAVAC